VVWEDGGSDQVSYPISTHTIPNAGITPLVAWSIFAFSVDFRAPSLPFFPAERVGYQ